MIFYLVSDDNMLFNGLSTLLLDEGVDYPLLKRKHSEYAACLFIVDARVARWELELLLYERPDGHFVILCFSSAELERWQEKYICIDMSLSLGAVRASLLKAMVEDAGRIRMAQTQDLFRPILTVKEKDVFRGLMMGKNVHQIAELCGCDIKTVYGYRRNLVAKLGFNNFNQLYLHCLG